MKKKKKAVGRTAAATKASFTGFLKRWLWRLLLLVIYTLFLYQLWLFSHVLYWKHNNPPSSAFMQSQLKILREDNPAATLRHTWVPYRKISYDMKRAIIVAEDSKFLQHDGFDYESIRNAFKKNLSQGQITVGGSTVSQQLAKNLFLSEQRSLWRKLQEAIITVMLETVMSKQRILEIYLNMIEWGNGVFGVEAAAQHYFGQSAASLTKYQATYLAAMVTNPRFYDKNRNSQHLMKKRNVLLGRMHSAKIP
ncbi:monofunctional biosynthetic peptidoglycan transglycosylase [Nitrosomonas sp. Nm51]|uniref:monofunctional biosynthetic peptidoglycan transglycosylase n=1 Tax=Nitrosomonas sp. Nm51 TaxID=133720 RepID=UPI0008C68848|nr:monofunctional biosynthetic peptidoglycan transglycosylase [Nitrosomonas sp. Nm51]SEQ86163.1 monofunctional biosynthetic peptidoglycan transglycosylase [Nitrosomonas sp. Nm51]